MTGSSVFLPSFLYDKQVTKQWTDMVAALPSDFDSLALLQQLQDRADASKKPTAASPRPKPKAAVPQKPKVPAAPKPKAVAAPPRSKAAVPSKRVDAEIEKAGAKATIKAKAVIEKPVRSSCLMLV